MTRAKHQKQLMKLEEKNDEANKLVPKFRELERILDKAELVCTKTDGTKYDSNRFALPLKFIEKIYNYEITLDKAIQDQIKLKILINKLNNDYTPRIPKKTNEKNRVLDSARKLSDARDEIINLFEKGIFPYKDNTFKTKEEKKEQKEQQTSKKELLKKPRKDDVSNFNVWVNKKETGINYELFEKHFKFKRPSDVLKSVYKTNDKKNNSKLVNVIKSRLSDLKTETEDMSEE